MDGGVAEFVAERRQNRDEGGEGVGRGTAENAGVQLGGERLDGHDDVDIAAQARGDRGVAHGGVAGVGDDDGVGAQKIGMLGDERLEPAGALLLRSLDHQFEVDRKVVAESAQGSEVHEEVALAVGRPRPYQRPSTSVRRNGGVLQASSFSGGCTS